MYRYSKYEACGRVLFLDGFIPSPLLNTHLNISKGGISAWLVTAVFATQEPVCYKTNRKMTWIVVKAYILKCIVHGSEST